MRIQVALIPVRMKRLPRRLRLAHLRALIRRELAGSQRGAELVALLRDKIASPLAYENREP